MSDYAETIQTKLGMTVDELMSALESGNAVFYNINPSLGQWNKTAPTKGSTGWYYDNNGLICDQSSEVASVELDKANKALVIDVPENSAAGLSSQNTSVLPMISLTTEMLRVNVPVPLTL